MARLLTSTFNTFLPWPTIAGAAQLSIQTSIANSITHAMRSNQSATWSAMEISITTLAADGQIFFQLALYIATAPDVTCRIAKLFTGGGDGPSIILNTDRTLELWDPSDVQIGSDSSALSLATWYFIEFAYTFNDGATSARLDTVEFAAGSSTAFLEVNTAHIATFGFSNVTTDLYFDDVIVNNNIGGADNTWPGGVKVPEKAVSIDSLYLPW